jgi:outer membrane protein
MISPVKELRSMTQFATFRLRSLVAVLALTAVSSQAAIKVGVADLQKALQTVKKGKTAKTALEKEFQEKKKKIDAEQEAIRKMSEEFQKKSLVLSEKARSEKGMEIQQRIAAWQEMVQKAQGEMQGREGEMTRPILEGLRTISGELAKKKSFELMFEANSSGLLYAADRTDITEELIKAFDEKNPK